MSLKDLKRRDWNQQSYAKTLNKAYQNYVDLCDYWNVPLAARLSRVKHFQAMRDLYNGEKQ